MPHDRTLLEEINELAGEEHELWKKEADGLTPAERERLKGLQDTLDQCWDLLHQRRARRNAGEDPNEARVRDVEQVEGYEG